jgi:hypothetical protein
MTHNDYFIAIQRARDAYFASLGREVDDSGLAEALRLQFEKGYTYDQLVEWLEQSAEYQSQHAAPPEVPPAVSAPLPPLQGQLGVDGMAFQDDTGRRVPLFCHAGDLLMLFVEGRTREDASIEFRVHQAFADLRDHGYAGLRSWWSIRWSGQPHRRARTNSYWGNRRLNPSNDAHRRLIVECLRIGAEDYGLRWHLALGSAEDIPAQQMTEAWHWMAEVVAAHPQWFALIEGLNEAYHTGEPDPAVVEKWVNISRNRNPTVLHALSAAAGAGRSEEKHELAKWTPDWQQIYLVHASRDNNWGDQTRHVFSTGYKRASRRLGWSGEPPGMRWGSHQRVSGMPQAHEWTDRPWRYALYLAVTAMCRQMPTFMCSHGVCLEGRFRDAPGFGLAPRLISDLPPDVMAYDEIFHGGETHKSRRVVEAPLHCRADHVKKTTGECVIAIYPERPDISTTNLHFDRDWTGRIHDEHGYIDAAIARGTDLSRDISSGLLLVGRVL